MLQKIGLYIGFLIFTIGICGADSECLLVPTCIVAIGLIMCYINRGAINYDYYDDDDDNNCW